METTDYKEIYKHTTFTFEGLEPFRYDTVPTDREFAVITAWNPNNQIESLQTNKANNEKLKNLLLEENYEIVFGQGGLGEHFEESYLVWDITPEEALEFGVIFEQYSIFCNTLNECGFYTCEDWQEIVSFTKTSPTQTFERLSPAMKKSIQRTKVRIAKLLNDTNKAMQDGKSVVVDDFSYDKKLNGGLIYLTIDGFTIPVPLSFTIQNNNKVIFDDNIIHSPYGVPASYGFKDLSANLEEKVKGEIDKRMIF